MSCNISEKIVYNPFFLAIIDFMAKIELELVKKILKRAELEDEVFTEIVDELQSAVDGENADEEPKVAPVKKQFVVLISDNEGKLVDQEWVGWVFQLPEDVAMQSITDRVKRAAKAFNLSKKGRRYPVETVGETCENVSARIFKEQKLWLKTKSPVLVVPIENALQLDDVNVPSPDDNFSDEEF